MERFRVEISKLDDARSTPENLATVVRRIGYGRHVNGGGVIPLEAFSDDELYAVSMTLMARMANLGKGSSTSPTSLRPMDSSPDPAD